MDTYVGFDSAWKDNSKAPGAICAVCIEEGMPTRFHAPQMASFDEAIKFINKVRSEYGSTLIALDQPFVVPNMTGMRPVERVTATLISWLGGGVQPSNRGREGMFCDNAPIWRFLTALGAKQDPEQARIATDGLYLIEVFPALALASLDTAFFGRMCAPKYNPKNKAKFRQKDWISVAIACASEAEALACEELAGWCRNAGKIAQPKKSDQDMLDSVLCILVALRWRLRSRETTLFLGDLVTGYMILPASQAVRERLKKPARKHSLEMDGKVQ